MSGDVSNVLGADTRPRFFPIADNRTLTPPAERHGLSLRTWARSLSGMQKEAVVLDGRTGAAWRLASDEGPYLAGFDEAPCPLSFLTTGMVASFMDGITERMGPSHDATLTLDNFYTMEGSALRGTMTGGALPPELSVTVSGAEAAGDVVRAAVAGSPITGLLGGVHRSRFTLSLNGESIPVGRVDAIDGDPEPGPDDVFAIIGVADIPLAGDVITRVTPADEVEDVPGGVNTSLAESQSRLLHVRGVCTRRSDGVTEVAQNLYSPIGSEFRYLSSETGTAPGAASYMAAGIAFCFMTQFGRYASIVRKDLASYQVVQDLHLSPDGSAADPVETHVFIDSDEGPDFARQILDMSEQTCFLHAACRTDLAVQVQVAAPVRA